MERRKQWITDGFYMLMPREYNTGGCNFELQTITFCKQTAYGVEEME